MDLLLRDLDPEEGLPFEDAPAPDLCVSIFRQFWGGCGGLVFCPASDKTPNCGGIKIEDMGKVSVEVEKQGEVEEMEEKAKGPVTCAGPPSQPPSIMTADTRA
jgi:hypothetical protein